MNKIGIKKLLLITIVSSVIISVILNIALLRACFGAPTYYSFFRIFVCGKNIVTTRTLFKKLEPQNMSVTSNIPESKEHSLDRGFDAKKLIDGLKTTMAYPGSQEIDYVVDLLDTYQVKSVNIVWGDSGKSKKYVSSWQLQAFSPEDDWWTIKEGLFPDEGETLIKETFLTNKLRLKAKSDENWIGAYELEIIGRLP